MVPTISVQDVDLDLETAKQKPSNGASLQPADDDVEKVPGALPAGPAPAIPDWYVVGWRQASGIDEPPLPEGEEKEKKLLDLFISEQFYGAWYHNAALIVFVGPYSAAHSQLSLSSSPGCLHISLSYSLRLWLRMALHPASCLQYVLQHVHGTCPAKCA